MLFVAVEDVGSASSVAVIESSRASVADAAGNHSFSDVVFLPHDVNERESAFVEVVLRSGKSVHPTPYHLLKTCAGGKPFQCLPYFNEQDIILKHIHVLYSFPMRSGAVDLWQVCCGLSS